MQRRRLQSLLCAAFAGLAASAAHAQPSVPAVSAPRGTAADQVVDSSYVIGAGDVVEIALVGRSDFDTRARVGTDGAVQLPMVGRLQAADRTVIQLADDVRQALIRGRYFTDPVVRVEVAGISSRYVTVLGSVGGPGLITLDRSYRLSEILARVGGLAAGADTVLLTRAGGETTQRISYDDIATGGDDHDPVVKSGDKIFVPSPDTRMFYVSGQVNSPGSFAARPGLTIRQAIARAGGVNENGSEKKIKVSRHGAKLPHVNLEDPVEVDDVITVGERLF